MGGLSSWHGWTARCRRAGMSSSVASSTTGCASYARWSTCPPIDRRGQPCPSSLCSVVRCESSRERSAGRRPGRAPRAVLSQLERGTKDVWRDWGCRVARRAASRGADACLTSTASRGAATRTRRADRIHSQACLSRATPRAWCRMTVVADSIGCAWSCRARPDVAAGCASPRPSQYALTWCQPLPPVWTPAVHRAAAGGAWPRN